MRACGSNALFSRYYTSTKVPNIPRRISTIIGNKKGYDITKPTAPYVPKHKKGPKPPVITGIAREVKLRSYDIDENLERHLNMDDWKESYRE